MTDMILDNLLALANAYTLTQTVNPAAQTLTLSLGSPTGPNLPVLSESIPQAVVQNVPLNLNLLLKNVRFATSTVNFTDPTDASSDNPIGGLPILNLLDAGIVETDMSSGSPTASGGSGGGSSNTSASGPGAGGTTGAGGSILPGGGTSTGTSTGSTGGTVGALPVTTPTVPPGVAGTLATVTGNIPLLVTNLVDKNFAVTAQVHWQIRDSSGAPATDVTTTLGTGSPSQSADIFPAAGSALDALVVSLMPSLVELTSTLPPASVRTITASVNVSAFYGTVLRASTGWIALPPVSFDLLVIPIPTIGVFFSNNLSGHALVVVPANSPITQATLIPTLNTLISSLPTSFVFNVSWLASLILGLPDLVSKLDAAKGVYFKCSDGVGDLSHLELQHPSGGGRHRHER